jgi:hypothetical protein
MDKFGGRYASKLEGKSTGFSFHVADYAGPHDVSRQILSSGVPERAPGDRGWCGLVGWMKGQIRMKTRNRGRDWAVFVHPDEKRRPGDLVGETVGDALSFLKKSM